MRQKILVAGILAILLLAMVVPADAQLDRKVRKADIPFAFYVEDQQFPAGIYLVSWMGGRLHIQSPDGVYSASVIVIPIESNKTTEQSALKFNRYDDATYLSKVWIGGRETGHELLRTKAEVDRAKVSSTKVYAMIRLGLIR